MSEYVLHPATRQHIERFMRLPTHALMITGPAGSGKDTVARIIACQLTGRPDVESLAGYAYIKTISPEKDKSSIGIETVRELQHFAKLKLPGQGRQSNWRIVHITLAETLTTEAQNAMLKLLEEPPDDMLILVASISEQNLLPTIRSRMQQLAVLRPSKPDIESYFSKKGYDTALISQAYMLSGGLPGLMHALLADSDHPLKQSVQTARQLLQMTQFERLAKVDSLAKDKAEAQQVLFVLRQMAGAALEQSAAKAAAHPAAGDKAIRQWHKVLRATSEAEQAYAVSGQAKLSLTHLMLSL